MEVVMTELAVQQGRPEIIIVLN